MELESERPDSWKCPADVFGDEGSLKKGIKGKNRAFLARVLQSLAAEVPEEAEADKEVVGRESRHRFNTRLQKRLAEEGATSRRGRPAGSRGPVAAVERMALRPLAMSSKGS